MPKPFVRSARFIERDQRVGLFLYGDAATALRFVEIGGRGATPRRFALNRRAYWISTCRIARDAIRVRRRATG